MKVSSNQTVIKKRYLPELRKSTEIAKRMRFAARLGINKELSDSTIESKPGFRAAKKRELKQQAALNLANAI